MTPHSIGRRVPLRLAPLAILAFLTLALLSAERADATFPGANGKIAYAASAEETISIRTVNPDGSSPQNLTPGASASFAPAYSPNGARIAFGRGTGVSVMNADGSGQVELVKGDKKLSGPQVTWVENYDVPDSAEVIPWVKVSTYTVLRHAFESPAFSPDGSQLAVGESDFEEIEKGVCGVAAENDADCLAEGEPGSYYGETFGCTECTERLITIDSSTGAITGQLTPAVVDTYDGEPTYSSSGALAFVRYTKSSGFENLFTIASPGSPPVQLTTGFYDYGPDFSPDGSRLIFTREGELLTTVAATGGPVTTLPLPALPAGFGAQYPTNPTFSPDGKQVAFALYRYPETGPASRDLTVMGIDGSAAHKVADGFAPAWQSIPIPPPAPVVVKSKAKGKKGKIRLDKKHKAKIATLTCGSAPCAVKVSSSKLKAGKKKCSVALKFTKSLAAGASSKVTANVKGKCLTKLEEAGKGKLAVKLSVTGANGTEKLSFGVTLLPPKKGKKG